MAGPGPVVLFWKHGSWVAIVYSSCWECGEESRVADKLRLEALRGIMDGEPRLAMWAKPADLESKGRETLALSPKGRMRGRAMLRRSVACSVEV
jgi:hypothetical protein